MLSNPNLRVALVLCLVLAFILDQHLILLCGPIALLLAPLGDAKD